MININEIYLYFYAINSRVCTLQISSDDNASDLCSGDDQIESRLGYQVTWLSVWVIFLRTSRQILG
jgi:hypothetical protein